MRYVVCLWGFVCKCWFFVLLRILMLIYRYLKLFYLHPGYNYFVYTVLLLGLVSPNCRLDERNYETVVIGKFFGIANPSE